MKTSPISVFIYKYLYLTLLGHLRQRVIYDLLQSFIIDCRPLSVVFLYLKLFRSLVKRLDHSNDAFRTMYYSYWYDISNATIQPIPDIEMNMISQLINFAFSVTLFWCVFFFNLLSPLFYIYCTLAAVFAQGSLDILVLLHVPIALIF